MLNLDRLFQDNQQKTPSPATTLSIDMLSLQLLTGVDDSNLLPQGFKYPVLDLLPSRASNTTAEPGCAANMYNLTSADPSSLAKYFTSEISDSGYVEHPKTVTSTYRSNQEVMQVLEEAMKAIYAGSPSEREEEMKRIYAERSVKREDASSNAAWRRYDTDLKEKMPHPDSGGWLSPMHAGFVGIFNMGATGYVNCTLQLLYMLKPFRMVIYFPLI